MYLWPFLPISLIAHLNRRVKLGRSWTHFIHRVWHLSVVTTSAWRTSGRGFRAEIPIAVFPSLHIGGTHERRHPYYRWHLQGVPMTAPWWSHPSVAHPRGLQGRELGTSLHEQTVAKAPAPLMAPNEDVIVSTLGKAVWFGSAWQSQSERLWCCPCQVATWSSHVHGHHRPCREDRELCGGTVSSTRCPFSKSTSMRCCRSGTAATSWIFGEKIYRKGRGPWLILWCFWGLLFIALLCLGLWFSSKAS